MAEGNQHARARLWAAVRFALGMAQMAGATVAAVMLVSTGVTVASLSLAVVTCVLTTLSVLLFGSPRHLSHGQRPHSKT